MEPKTPVLLVVLVEVAPLRWFVGSLGLEGQTTSLLCSEMGDLAHYQGLEFDEQVAFLRHRFCGILQRGCDRLWARRQKACHFVIVFDRLLPEPSGLLTEAVADHFTQWMLNPPVSVLVSKTGFADEGPLALEILTGQLEPSHRAVLDAHLGALLARQNDPAAWELARQGGVWCSAREVSRDES